MNRIYQLKRGRARLAILLAIVLALPIFPVVKKDVSIARDESNMRPKLERSKDTMGLCTDMIANPSTSGEGWSMVWYGKYDGQVRRYRVLSKRTSEYSGNTMLLECGEVFGATDFSTTNSNTWKGSDLYEFMNGSGFLNKEGVFTSVERSAIVGSTKSAGEDMNFKDVASSYREGIIKSVALTGEKVFPLDITDLYNSNYGFVNEENRGGQKLNNAYDPYDCWLRSPVFIVDYNRVCAGTVRDLSSSDLSNGKKAVGAADVNCNSRGREYIGISPAFNIDLSSILYTTLHASKGWEEEMAGKIGSYYTLTLIDPSLRISRVGTPSVTPKNRIHIPVSAFGDLDDISVLMLDKEYKPGNPNGATIKYYERAVGDWDSYGIGAEISLPTDYDPSWKTYVIAEKMCDYYETDYSSEPMLVDMSSIPFPLPTPSVTATAKATPTGTSAPTASVSPKASASASPSASPSGSATPTASASVSPTASASASPSISPSASPSVSPAPSASAKPSVTPTIKPTISPTPSIRPTATPVDKKSTTVGGITYRKKGDVAVVSGCTRPKATSLSIRSSVKIGDGYYMVSGIEKEALSGLKYLEKVKFGDFITSIGAGAFDGCTKLKTITLGDGTPRSIGKNAFRRIYKKAVFRVPKSCYKDYRKKIKKKSIGWKKTMKIRKY